MKIYIAFALIAFVFSGLAIAVDIISEEEDGTNMKYFLVETSEGVFEIEDLVHSKIEVRVSASDITYHYFSRGNPGSGIKLRINDVSVLNNTDFSASRDTLVLIHGWRSNNVSTMNLIVRQSVLSQDDVNVIVVDWNPAADRNYISAKSSVVPVGNYIATFIQALVSTYGLQLSRISCVGHSLGAHVCGAAGAALNGLLHHIVGLDPALPLYSVSNIDDRLDTTDAQFVQIIHTNGGLLGFAASIGHSDYFPNGGRSQPGCGLDIAGGCAHSRAYIYYDESISANENLFISRQCSSYTDYSRGLCNSSAESVLGGYGVDTAAEGDYYLTTNSGSLYARG